MKIKSFILNPFMINCYVYYDESSRESVIIDPAVSNDEEQNEIIDFINKNGLEINNIINTHGHIDHVMGNKWAKKTFKAQVLMNEGDIELLESISTQGSLFGLSVESQPKPDKLISDNDLISFNRCDLKVIHTPGHSLGSICLVDESNKLIFTGDTLFKNSVGRTDLPGGDTDILLNSIKNKILNYPDDYLIYPGHMGTSSIGDERRDNPFLNREL